MKTKTRLVIILSTFILIFLLILTFTTFPTCDKPQKIILIQNGNYSSGSYWEYELSTDDVINEVDYHTSQFFLNFGPGYQQNWEFEIIGEGEVTIHWLSYVGGGDFKESESYSQTYVFDSEGNCTIKSDERY